MERTLAQYPTENRLIKLVCFGPESTGKTTLAFDIATYFGTMWVPEYMRTYLQKKWDEEKSTCQWEDLMPIAYGQMEWENYHAQRARNILVCDTNLLELMTYSQLYYNGRCPKEIEHYALRNTYDLYFLTAIDVPWQPDDLRDRPNDRPYMFEYFKKILEKHQKPYITLVGNPKERLQTAISAIHKIMKNYE